MPEKPLLQTEQHLEIRLSVQENKGKILWQTYF